MHSSLKVLLQYFNKVAAWTLTEPMQHLFLAILLQICCQAVAMGPITSYLTLKYF